MFIAQICTPHESLPHGGGLPLRTIQNRIEKARNCDLRAFSHVTMDILIFLPTGIIAYPVYPCNMLDGSALAKNFIFGFTFLENLTIYLWGRPCCALVCGIFWLTRKNGGNGLKEHKGKLTARKRSAQAVPGVSLSPTRFRYIYKYANMDIQIF